MDDIGFRNLQKKQMRRRSLLKSLGLFSGSMALSENVLAQSTFSKKSVRIAHITDIHIQPHIGAAKGFEKCLHHIQSLEKKCDFIINGGDAIMGMHGASENSIEKQWDIYKSILKSENSIAILNCIGNHDIFRKSNNPIDFLTGKKTTLDHLSLNKSYYSYDVLNWRILILDSIQPCLDGKGYQGKVDEKQFNWLKEELKEVSKDKNVMIVSHIPILSACVFLDGKNFKNGEWHVPETWMHGDAEELVELFAKHPNVKLAISGHIHLTDRIEYNQVSYCCNGAVSGNWWMGSYKQTKPGYALIDLFEDGSFENKYVIYS